MKLEILKNEEKIMNKIMFAIWGFILPVVAFIYVELFLLGSLIDAVVFMMPVFALIIKLFEKKLGPKAKYFYSCIMPVCGTLIIVIGNDGCFGAMSHAYFLATVMIIAYFDVSVIKVNAIATIVLNAVAMLIFPEAYTKMHTIALWIFILMVYVLTVIAACLIAQRTYSLFVNVESNEKEMENLITDVHRAFGGIEDSTESIQGALSSFEQGTREIAVSTEAISNSADQQISEVNGSIEIFNTLNNKISESEQQVNTTVNTMNLMKAKNDEGIVSIQALSAKFDENINATEKASERIRMLSQKSSAISSIVDSIHDIAQQTNLLALNAAIEAARAGEAGKGFAVVADEINSLSAESSQATQKIDAILKDIIEMVESTSDIMDQNSAIVKDSFEHLNGTIKIFENMLHSSEEVISVTVLLKQELEDIVEIKDSLLKSMESLEQMSQHSVQTSTEISSSTEEQVTGIKTIVTAMDRVQESIGQLASILEKK